MTVSWAPAQTATVFGGTGFLGRRVVRRLREAGFAVRFAARHPERGRSLFADGEPGIASIRADINEESAVAAAIAGSYAVVNAVGLYVERGKDTFRSVHVSGIGADAGSPSAYIRSRGEGEAAVLRAFAAATLIRPAVMFGPDDAFVAPLLSMLRRLPAFPLFGTGGTRLQPVYVEDIGEAVARIMRLPATERVYELAGPQVYDYRSLLLLLGKSLGRERLLLPVPFALWKIIGTIGQLLPAPPITRSQVELMECDNIASPGVPGFANLGMTPRSLEEILPQINPGHGRAPEPAAP
jgi:uncharacterized protein YbjT (DUF2867 family)